MEHDISYYKILATLLITLALAGLSLYGLRFVIDFFRAKILPDKNTKEPLNSISILQHKYIDNKRKIIAICYRDNTYLLLLQDGAPPTVLDTLRNGL